VMYRLRWYRKSFLS